MGNDNELLSAALAKYLAEFVSEDVRKDVLAKAIKDHLFRVDDRGNGILKSAFERALNDAVALVAKEVINTPETYAKVREAMVLALNESLDKPAFRERLLSKLEYGLRY